MDGRHLAEDTPVSYQIRVRGTLDSHWLGWFAGLTITLEADGNTLLEGLLADQAALYGVINRLRDLGLTLLGVVQLTPPEDWHT
ncbi:MAG: hypothetical protein ACJ8CR_25210 [Roseiflexaceae bacterium]